MADTIDTRNISDIIQRSAVANDARLMRTGLDAAGLTAEFDESARKSNESLMKMFPDEELRQEILERSSDSERRIRESLRQYEIQQVVAGAERESVIRLDNMQKGFAEYATLEMGRLEKEREDNLAKETAMYEARLKEITMEKEQIIYEHQRQVAGGESEAEGRYDAREERRLAKEAFEERCIALQNVYDKGVRSIGTRFQSLGEDMHTVHFNTRKSLMDDDSAANAVASHETGKRMKGLIDGFTKSGYTTLAGFLIGRYSDRNATAVPLTREKRDSKGNAILDGNGNPVMESVVDEDGKPVYDMSKYNPGGRVWMSIGDVVSLKDSLDSEIAERARKATAAADSVAADAKAAASAIEISFMEEARKSDPGKAEAILDRHMDELLKHAAADPDTVRQVQGRMVSEAKSLKEKAERRKAVYQGAAHRYGGYDTARAIAEFNSAINSCDDAYARSVAVKYIDGNGDVGRLGDVDADFVVAAHCDAMLERTDLDADTRNRVNETKKEALERKRAREARGFMAAINSIGFIRKDVQAVSGNRKMLVGGETGVQTGEQVYLDVNKDGLVEIGMDRSEKLTFVYKTGDKTAEYEIGKVEAKTLFASLFRVYERIVTSHDTEKGKGDTEAFAKYVQRTLIDEHMKGKAADKFNWLAVSEAIGRDIQDNLFKPNRMADERQLKTRMYMK